MAYIKSWRARKRCRLFAIYRAAIALHPIRQCDIYISRLERTQDPFGSSSFPWRAANAWGVGLEERLSPNVLDAQGANRICLKLEQLTSHE